LVAREIDDHNFDKPERERASRLPKEWEPNGRDLSFATRTLGGLLAVEDELAKFRDHWAAKPGAGGRKLDWDATWRNWVRTAKDRQRGPPRTPSFIELENELRKAHAYDRPDDDQTPDLLGDHFTDPPD
jgi:hypothetical protein